MPLLKECANLCTSLSFFFFESFELRSWNINYAKHTANCRIIETFLLKILNTLWDDITRRYYSIRKCKQVIISFDKRK